MGSPILKSVNCPEARHPAGTVIFREGSVGDCFYIVKSGEIEIYKRHGEPDQVLLATIPAGRVLGEISSMDSGPRTATAVAKTDVHVVTVSSQSLKWQLGQCPQWFRSVVLDLVERLRGADELIATAHPGNHSSLKSTAE